ncbi:unnamed protein product, partial [Strongylus vulgaris]
MVTADTSNKASTWYCKIKHIFNGLGMNIREFVCNYAQLAYEMADADKSSELFPKLLGVRWNSTTDQLQILCTMIEPKIFNKRQVTRIASVYDPMGWILPLLHKSKVFLRSLWNDKFDWDTKLPHRINSWRQICQEMQGFGRQIPRFVTKRYAQVTLVAFVDASTEAMATCIYLKSQDSVYLLL